MSKLGGVAQRTSILSEEERSHMLADEDFDSFCEMSDDKSPSTSDVSSDEDQEATEIAESEEPSKNHLGVQNACHSGGISQCGTTNSKLDWHSTEFRPTVFTFDDNESGLSSECTVTEESEEIDFFLEFFDDDLVDVIVQETNRFYELVKEKQRLTRSSKIYEWEATTRKEIYMFLCVYLLMAHAKKYSLKEYWTEDPVFEIPVFKKLMSQDRFIMLLQLLHFCDNGQHQVSDRLRKIQPILDLLRKKFRTKFKPFQDLCIEYLVLWEGQVVRRHLMPKKFYRYGAKLSLLFDVDSGYILDFIMDISTKAEVVKYQGRGSAVSVVKALMSPYLGKGHNLYVDYWYTSPKLFAHLLKNNTGACGQVRANKKNMPTLPNITRGEVVSCHKDNILCIKWCNKRVVHMLTTIHKDKMLTSDKIDLQSGAPIRKPAALLKYIKTKQLVDTSNTLLNSIRCIRKNAKWYVNLFFHMLDISVLNAYSMYLVKTSKNPSLLDFHRELIHQIIKNYSESQPDSRVGRLTRVSPNLDRLTARHFPIHFQRRRCHVCAHTTRRKQMHKNTNWMCHECHTSLCVPKCFKEYHTIEDF